MILAGAGGKNPSTGFSFIPSEVHSAHHLSTFLTTKICPAGFVISINEGPMSPLLQQYFS